MESSQTNGPPPNPGLPEGLVRTLRHEIGDFLQTVYSTAAILQARLPNGPSLERTIVANLRSRAEACKHLLDTVHDVVFPIALVLEPVRLGDLAAQLVADATARYPHLDIRAETDVVPRIRADVQRLVQVGNRVLENACQSARSQVRLRTSAGPGPDEVTWTVTDDGAAVPEDQMERLFDVFTTSRRGTLGLGLGQVRKVVELHGGRVEAVNQPEGGMRVSVTLPREPPEPDG